MSTQSSGPGRRWVRRIVVIAASATVLWLAGSLGAACWLTRRPHRPFAEPPPRLAWGTVESHRLETRDGQQIGAWFLSGDDQAPSVLLLHGNRGSRRNCLDRAEIYAHEGCSVLLISLRAHGDSTGKFNDIGYSARHDVVAAVEFLQRRRPGRPVLIHGVSMGAAAATFAAQVLGTRAAGYILESPYRDLKVAVRNRTRAHLPPGLDWLAYQGLAIVAPLVLPELEQISPLAAVGHIPAEVPILLLSGDADHLARPEEAQAIYDRVHAHAVLRRFPHAGHGRLLARDRPTYRATILEYLARLRSTVAR